MKNQDIGHDRSLLQSIARKAMSERGLLNEFSTEALNELAQMEKDAPLPSPGYADLRELSWCSIDNDDSRDLDQLTFAKQKSEKVITIFVAIADVDFLIKKDSSIDQHAKTNTTSIYTSAEMFPMLPLKISTDLTSLNLHQVRQAVVVEMDVDDEGKIASSKIYMAIVRNYAKLSYNIVGPWLENIETPHREIFDVANLSESLILQNKVAQLLKHNRYLNGALDFDTIETKAVFNNDQISNLEVNQQNLAKELIEEFMVAANTASVSFLKEKGLVSFKRIVRSPERWAKIVNKAEKYNYTLPQLPDALALSKFLQKEKVRAPLLFPDLSLAIIKLLGRGEYVVLSLETEKLGHFGLAITNYTHSTAPNRRFPDLVTQRMIKHALLGTELPYTLDELTALAKHCTLQEDVVNKVERRVSKSAGALLLSKKIGNVFEAVCTGASEKGTWVRIFSPSIEGRLVQNFSDVDVGDRLRVRLMETNIQKGFIDFDRV